MNKVNICLPWGPCGPRSPFSPFSPCGPLKGKKNRKQINEAIDIVRLFWGNEQILEEFAELFISVEKYTSEGKSNLQGLVGQVDLQLFQLGIDHPWKWLLGLGPLYRHDLPVNVIGWYIGYFLMIFSCVEEFNICMFVMTVFLLDNTTSQNQKNKTYLNTFILVYKHTIDTGYYTLKNDNIAYTFEPGGPISPGGPCAPTSPIQKTNAKTNQNWKLNRICLFNAQHFLK